MNTRVKNGKTEPTLECVYEFFKKNTTGSLWVPTKTRNEIIADEGFSSTPKFATGGRLYRWEFKSIGGGMWDIRLHYNSSPAPLSAKSAANDPYP